MIDVNPTSSSLPRMEREDLLHRITQQIRQSGELSQILKTTVQAVRTFLDTDRVKIYAFYIDGSGEVVAESVAENRLPSLLGLRFPADDIPFHARKTLIEARQRVIVDVLAGHKATEAIERSETNELQPSADPHYAPVDPCHRKYLRAMGVASSLVMPILVQEHLWGLVVSHHSEARTYSERELQVVQLLTERLEISIAQDRLLQRATQQVKHEAIAHQISSILHANQPVPQRKQAALEEIVRALESDGGRLYIIPNQSDRAPQLYRFGEQPQLPYLEETPFWQEIFHTHNGLVEKHQEWESCPLPQPHPTLDPSIYHIRDLYEDSRFKSLWGAFRTTRIRSISIVPLRYYHRCIGCLTIFRHEIETEVLWAGQRNRDPRNQLPRQSFAAWRERSKAIPPPWSAAEIKLAQDLGLRLYMAIMERRLQETIDHHSNHDSLTGLPNRMLFRDRLSLTLANSHLNRGEIIAVLFLDFDGFKNINDTLGHHVGDRLLQQAAKRLVSCLRGGDLVARWGGDEFTILLSSITSNEKAAAVALKILAALSVPFPCEDRNLYIKASLGIALAPYHGEDADTLLKHADAAMYRAKQQGRNTYQLYTPAIGIHAQQRLQLEHSLYLALERQEFCLYYQPQISLQTGAIVGVEALIRWNSPELGWVSPAQFIPLAEETGLINPIGEWVLQTACYQSKLWQSMDLPSIQISVNLSARQFQNQQLLKTITQVLESTGVNPHQLELEITESIAMQDMEFTISVLEKIRQLGIQIAMDDFGTGYSSLAALKHFPLDKLKIDRSFVRDLTIDSHDAAIVNAIVALGHGLNLEVIAEGVETKEHIKFLQRLDCDVAQGYWLSRPIPAQVATQLLVKGEHFSF